MIVCTKCGKTVEGEGVAFCPYCGERLPAETAPRAPEKKDPEAEKWIAKALSVASYPERKKILSKGKAACPDSPEIDWELLFIGEEAPRKMRSMDFSVIRSWNLEMYRKPGEFSKENRERMRAALFDYPALKSILQRAEDPEKKLRDYILRLCREYIEIFLEGNSQVMGVWFGFQIDRNREKKLAAPVAFMIERIREDEKLPPETREQLWKALYQAYAARVNGKTEYLDEAMKNA